MGLFMYHLMRHYCAIHGQILIIKQLICNRYGVKTVLSLQRKEKDKGKKIFQ